MDQFSKGFSLVELSIVLVILGLLTGGILTGQSLIKAAELRAVTTEFNHYQIAINTFKSKYLWIPGDMNDATLYWGKLAAHCNSAAGTAQVNGTCNGNANNYFENAAGASQEAELYLFWQHLTFAKIIEGQYTGISGPASDNNALPDQNVPSSKYEGGAWDIDSEFSTGSIAAYQTTYGNALKFAAPETGDDIDNPILTPEQTWNIDKKMDDGLPGKGSVIARFWDTCTTSTANNDLTGTYLISDKTVQCAIYFINTVQ